MNLLKTVWTCKLLLVLASTDNLGSETRGNPNHILLSHDSFKSDC
jgi:hypothetical protein